MRGSMSWITNNLKYRQQDPLIDFRVDFNPEKFTKTNFGDISHLMTLCWGSVQQPLYLAYSGGIDSEYILRKFWYANRHITPIVIDTKHNYVETEYAKHTLKELNIEPIWLDANDTYLQSVFNNKILKPFNGDGINCTPTIIAAMVAQQRNGLLITGDHFISDHDRGRNHVNYANRIDAAEHEWYHYELFPKNVESFFMLNPAIAHAMAREMIGNENLTVAEFKSKLYKLPYRPKMRIELKGIVKPSQDVNVRRVFDLGTPQEFCERLESWNN